MGRDRGQDRRLSRCSVRILTAVLTTVGSDQWALAALDSRSLMARFAICDTRFGVSSQSGFHSRRCFNARRRHRRELRRLLAGQCGHAEAAAVPDSSRMVWFMTTAPEGEYANASEAKFNAWRSIPSTFASIAAFQFPDMTLTAGDRFESVFAGEVTPEFFQLFGAHTQVGRTFTGAEGRPGATRVVVISDGFWTRRFQRGRAIGETLRLDGRSYVVVGILEPGFDTATATSAQFPAPDVWVPLQIDPASTTLEAQFLVAGRLQPSVSLAEAQSRAPRRPIPPPVPWRARG